MIWSRKNLIVDLLSSSVSSGKSRGQGIFAILKGRRSVSGTWLRQRHVRETTTRNWKARKKQIPQRDRITWKPSNAVTTTNPTYIPTSPFEGNDTDLIRVYWGAESLQRIFILVMWNRTAQRTIKITPGGVLTPRSILAVSCNTIRELT